MFGLFRKKPPQEAQPMTEEQPPLDVPGIPEFVRQRVRAPRLERGPNAKGSLRIYINIS